MKKIKVKIKDSKSAIELPGRTGLTRLLRAIRLATAMNLRVAQLFENIRSDYMQENPGGLFYVENDGLADMIHDYLNKTYEMTKALDDKRKGKEPPTTLPADQGGS